MFYKVRASRSLTRLKPCTNCLGSKDSELSKFRKMNYFLIVGNNLLNSTLDPIFRAIADRLEGPPSAKH